MEYNNIHDFVKEFNNLLKINNYVTVIMHNGNVIKCRKVKVYGKLSGLLFTYVKRYKNGYNSDGYYTHLKNIKSVK